MKQQNDTILLSTNRSGSIDALTQQTNSNVFVDLHGVAVGSTYNISLAISLVDTHGFAIIIVRVLPSHHHLRQGHADGAPTGPLATGNLTVVLVDIPGSAVISACAVSLIITHKSNIVTAYAGALLHLPTSFPTST